MIVPESSGLRLTPEQRNVVTLPWDTKALVIAGAGAGKTTTVVGRIGALTNAEGLNAADLLVLSFSRAAVRELRDRLDNLPRSTGRVRAQTFDSWATSVLMQQDPQRRDLVGVGFDGRIRLATEAVEAGVLDSFEYGPPAHVVIDEVQDLVGPRREMVEALLDSLGDNAGFTAVGDSAQSIYGFGATDGTDETNRFLEWVRRSFDVVELTLTDNFRARTPEARVALPFGPRLTRLPAGEKAVDAARVIEAELHETLLRTPHFGALDEKFTQDSLRSFEDTTAILCRTNGQVLLLSEKLAAAGVDHHVQRSPQDRAAPAWLSELLNATHGSTITETEFEAITSTIAEYPEHDTRTTWRALRRVASYARDRIDLNELVRVIDAGRLPDELIAAQSRSLVISTIHRAKGLEFDRVLVVEPDPPKDRDPADIPEEARLLYVAMTRARDDLYRLTAPRTWSVHKNDRLGRWYVSGRKRWERHGLEATERDVCRARPPGTGTLVHDPVACQKYLLSSVRVGDAVELHRLHGLAAEEETPPYGIHHQGTRIGEVSEQFRRDLWQLLKIDSRWQVSRFPASVRGLRIESLETVAGPAAFTERHDLGTRGVWVVPRLVGLGRFRWHDSETAEEGSGSA
jgi:hypothetical protein